MRIIQRDTNISGMEDLNVFQLRIYGNTILLATDGISARVSVNNQPPVSVKLMSGSDAVSTQSMPTLTFAAKKLN